MSVQRPPCNSGASSSILLELFMNFSVVNWRHVSSFLNFNMLWSKCTLIILVSLALGTSVCSFLSVCNLSLTWHMFLGKVTLVSSVICICLVEFRWTCYRTEIEHKYPWNYHMVFLRRCYFFYTCVWQSFCNRILASVGNSSPRKLNMCLFYPYLLP